MSYRNKQKKTIFFLFFCCFLFLLMLLVSPKATLCYVASLLFSIRFPSNTICVFFAAPGSTYTILFFPCLSSVQRVIRNSNNIYIYMCVFIYLYTVFSLQNFNEREVRESVVCVREKKTLAPKRRKQLTSEKKNLSY